MQDIIFVSHCILNTASKVFLYNQKEIDAEEFLRKKFLTLSISNNIQIIQLPCPEFTLYGPKRWGHVSNQFDNVFFRKHCRKILQPFIEQLIEYLNHPETFNVLGIIGIDGSPSCGVDYTCSADWYGSFECRKDLLETLNACKLSKGNGIFMNELVKMLKYYNIFNSVRVSSLYANEPEKCLQIVTK
ncbi:MAG: hypothetical protein VB122_00880 [Erysipelotrichales bacterium]|nr:hypothetical protein [Erysipelotrichales bacterium]